jgi:hypothetical protein
MSFDEALKLLEVLKWPAVAILGLFIFRRGFESLLARVQRAAIGGRAVEFAEPAAIASEQQQQKQIAKVVPTEPAGVDFPPPPPSPALLPIEGAIETAISASNASEEIKRAWLIRGAAVARLERAHEITYRLILGSQISLMLQANSALPVTVEAARAIYDEAKEKNPEIYKTFDFDNWLAWPKNTGLTKLEQDASNKTLIKVTDVGRDLLHYLINSGLTSSKAG